MMKAVTKLHVSPPLALLGALALTIAIAAQYPGSTTFPIGGDAAAHISVAQTLLHPSSTDEVLITLKTSNYPLSQLMFASTGVVPANWPQRFTWWMTSGHIMVGLALAALLWRISSWRAAAAGLAIWALTPIGIGTHFEDATAPQLWSLFFLLLTFERLAANSLFGTLLMLAATAYAHFLSGFILILSLVIGTVLLFPVRARLAPKQTKLIKYLGILIGLLVIFALYKLLTGVELPFIENQSEDFFLIDILKSKFAPWLVLAIPGLAILVSKLRFSLPAAASLLSFIWLSFLLTTNSSLNVGIWENRFSTYFVVSVCLAAGLALPTLVKTTFNHRWLSGVFILLLFGSLATITWRENDNVYSYYESAQNRARLHPEVQAAITWANDNLPADSFIVSSSASRQTEWIPVLTTFQWQALNASHELIAAPDTFDFSA